MVSESFCLTFTKNGRAATTKGQDIMASVIKQGQVVETASGKLCGEQVSDIHRFRGVRYGQSTGGANRFLRAQPVDPWSGVREAVIHGPRTPQPEEQSSGLAWRGWIRDRSEIKRIVLNI
jgi:hypothetical protein